MLEAETYALFKKTTNTVMMPFNNIQKASIILFSVLYSFLGVAGTGDGRRASSFSLKRRGSKLACLTGGTAVREEVENDNRPRKGLVKVGAVTGEGVRAAMAAAGVMTVWFNDRLLC